MKYSVVTRLRIRDLNDHLTCKLCSGYLVDATTLVVCQQPHSFCRSCLWKYLENRSQCPVCEAEINRSQLKRLVRPDHTLQDLVYKLVPHLYKNELKRRRDFYFALSQSDRSKDGNEKDVSAEKASTSSAKSKGTDGRKDGYSGKDSGNGRIQIFDRHFVELAGFICTPEEIVSLSVEYAPQASDTTTPVADSPPPKKRKRSKSSTDAKACAESEQQQNKKPCKRKQKEGTKSSSKKRGKEEKTLENLTFKRYFRCPAAVTVNHLKKLLHYKLELSSNYQIELLHSDEVLHGEYTLMDIAYIFNWRRKAPMQFHFNICKFEMDESLDQMPQLTREASPPVLSAETSLSPCLKETKCQSQEIEEKPETKREERGSETSMDAGGQAQMTDTKAMVSTSSQKTSVYELFRKQESLTTPVQTTTTTSSCCETPQNQPVVAQAPVRKKRKPTSPSKKMKNPVIQPNPVSQPQTVTTTTTTTTATVGVSAGLPPLLVTSQLPASLTANKLPTMDTCSAAVTTTPLPTTSIKSTTPSTVIGLSTSQPAPLQPAYQKSVHFSLPQSAASAPPAIRPTILPATTTPQIINGSFAILTSGNGNRSGSSGNCTGSAPTRTLGIVLFGEPPQMQVINGSRVCT